jgi:hypothetical protein
MKVYKYIPDSDTFDSILLKDNSESYQGLFAKGVKIKQDLSGLEFNKIEVGRTGDFLSLYGWLPVLTLAAWEILEDHIGAFVQPIKVKSGSSTYVMLNVLEVIDCLDMNNSEIIKNSITKQISRILVYTFHEEKLNGKLIFKLPETTDLEVYVTEDFKKLIEKEQLQGLFFDTPLNEK